jgi:FAD/FMN-containing dehydrogenase
VACSPQAPCSSPRAGSTIHVSSDPLESWGRYPPARQRAVVLTEAALPDEPGMMLPRGLGRSYGDVCLNDGGALLLTQQLARVHEFNEETGVLRAGAGATFSDLLELIVPRGWFLAVVPGTRFITLGGAIANDVHGKNHHSAGSFGLHVTRFELARSDGTRVVCTATENADLFRATIGGLGLTGLITWAELRLTRIKSPAIAARSQRFYGLHEFASLSATAGRESTYVVAWVDALAAEPRGVLFSGDHADANVRSPLRGKFSVPFDCPSWALSAPTVRAFNALYLWRHPDRRSPSIQHYEPFFFPLDDVAHWNRLYGKRGLLQWQGAFPGASALDAVREVVRRVARSGAASPLAVLKVMGAQRSPGMLAFSRPSITLALDFAFRGKATLDLLDDLDTILADCGGALYPAKDARMSVDTFRRSFPQWSEFSRYVDPRLSSGFWRRVNPQ